MIQDKKKIVIVLVVIVVLAGLGYKYYLGRSYKDPNLIRASGNIEVTDVEMSFKIPGHVDKRLFLKEKRLPSVKMLLDWILPSFFKR